MPNCIFCVYLLLFGGFISRFTSAEGTDREENTCKNKYVIECRTSGKIFNVCSYSTGVPSLLESNNCCTFSISCLDNYYDISIPGTIYVRGNCFVKVLICLDGGGLITAVVVGVVVFCALTIAAHVLLYRRCKTRRVKESVEPNKLTNISQINKSVSSQDSNDTYYITLEEIPPLPPPRPSNEINLPRTSALLDYENPIPTAKVFGHHVTVEENCVVQTDKDGYIAMENNTSVKADSDGYIVVD